MTDDEFAPLEDPTPVDLAIGSFVLSRVVREIAMEMIESGQIDPQTSTVAEVEQEATRRAHELLASDEFELKVVITHEDDLLNTARDYVRNGRHSYALMFYATYFEHVLNRLMMQKASAVELEDNDSLDLVRKSISDKTGAVWRLLFGSPFPAPLRHAINEIAAVRNAFVHYKWQPIPDEKPSETEAREAHQVEMAEFIVSGLEALSVAVGPKVPAEIYEWLRATPKLDVEGL